MVETRDDRSDGRLVVVSNRLPLTLRRAGEGWRAERSAGGLVTALAPIIGRGGGLWIGWPGEPPEGPDPGRAELLRRWEDEHGFAAVDLPRKVAQRFYHGYPNQSLWPLFHDFPSRLEFDTEAYAAYVEANEAFCGAVVERLRPGDRVWVHDYHLMLLPRLLREAAPETAIGFFLHIPFPPSDIFRCLPRREELLEGLLGADYVAFQTHEHLQHFRESLLRVLGVPSQMDRVDVEGRFARLDATPIGIVPDEFTALLEQDASVAAALADLRRRYEGRRLLLAVDRLDYTKGIPERLRAFRRLLERAPELRGKPVLVQVAVPSRERIGRYRELGRQVNELVGEINGHFATPDWTPVVYIRRSIPRSELVALYAAADVGWVTPLRDGMNLVAKEYVTCKRGGDGVLLLSEFAGAAAEMGEAFLVNPYDVERTAAQLERALAISPEERRERMSALYRRVCRNNAFSWSERFLKNLDEAARARVVAGADGPEPLPLETVQEQHRRAKARLLLLDYDGTLVGFAARPKDAVPPEALMSLLARLARMPRQRVAIVSGRPASALEEWFGGVEGLWLAAEHGAIVRAPGNGRWAPLRPQLGADWKARVIPVLEHFVDRTPGSFIEEKQYSLVWHHRMADPEFGEWLANELVATLAALLAETDLKPVKGHKSVEVRLVWAHKGEVVGRLEDPEEPAEFRLAIGDDRTDEDLFARLPSDAWTVRVGEGPTRARYRLANHAAVRQLLEKLAESG